MVIAWQDWSPDVLERSRVERRPVLLWIVASWCRFCDEMASSTFADAQLQATVAEHCIPVRIDKESHPEVDARYNQGGWPTTVLLDGAGELLAGATYADAPRLTELIGQATRVFRREGVLEEIGAADEPTSVGRLTDDILPAIDRALLVDFDERHGGFGSGQKFTHAEALDYAILRHAECRNPRLHEIIEKTLTKMAAGMLHDEVDGGFFRYCARRDWRQPHTEKLLEANAGLARNYLEAGQLMARADFLAVGERTIDVLLEAFLDRDTGLFHAALDPDDDYYALAGADRRTRLPPNRAGRFLADGNARAVSALLKAGAVLGRPDLTERALAVVDQLLERLYKPGRGMYHYHDGEGVRFPGHLRDQSETARALLHVLQYTDDRRFLAPLEDLVEIIATHHVLPDGEFGPRGDARSATQKRRADTVILESAIAAEVLLRGALYLGRPALTELARRALELHADDFRRHGYAMAAYGRSVALVLHPPLHIVVAGDAGDPRTTTLLAAASATYLPSRVVQRLDPRHDDVRLRQLGLPLRETPRAYVFLARACAGAYDEADPLRDGLKSANVIRLRD